MFCGWLRISYKQVNKEPKYMHIEEKMEEGEEEGDFVKHLGFLFLAHTLESPWQKLNGRK